MFEKLGWLTVAQLAVYHTVLSVFKIRKSEEPEYLFQKLSHDNLRGNIIIPVTQLSLAMKSFCWRGAEDWNRLPDEIRSMDNIGQFKAKLKEWTGQNIHRFPD